MKSENENNDNIISIMKSNEKNDEIMKKKKKAATWRGGRK